MINRFSLDNQLPPADLFSMFWRRPKSLDEKDVAADPGRLELLWLLRKELDEASLEEIAGCEGVWIYAYQKALAEILRTGKVPCPLLPAGNCSFLMGETLELCAPLSLEQRRHEVMRLFASWILVNAYTRPERERDGYIEQGDELALQNLTEISVALGPEFVRAAIRLILWAQSEGAATHDPVATLFYLLSLLTLRCALPGAEEIAAAPAVYDMLVAEERKVRSQMSEDESANWNPEPAWLFGLYDGNDDPRCVQRRWVKTAAWVVNRLDSSTSGELDPRLGEFKRRLLEL